MTLQKSNIKKCDELMQKWNQGVSVRKKVHGIIHILGSHKKQKFLDNEDFDEALRRSIIEN